MRLPVAIVALSTLLSTACARTLFVTNGGFGNILLVEGSFKPAAGSAAWKPALGIVNAGVGTRFVAKHTGVQTAQVSRMLDPRDCRS